MAFAAVPVSNAEKGTRCEVSYFGRINFTWVSLVPIAGLIYFHERHVAFSLCDGINSVKGLMSVRMGCDE